MGREGGGAESVVFLTPGGQAIGGEESPENQRKKNWANVLPHSGPTQTLILRESVLKMTLPHRDKKIKAAREQK